MMSFRLPRLFTPRPTPGIFEQIVREDCGDHVREILVHTTEFVKPNIPDYDEYSLPQLLAAGVNVTPVDPTVIPVSLNNDTVASEIDNVLTAAESTNTPDE